MHCLHGEMTNLLVRLLGRFIKKDVIENGKDSKDLLNIDLSDVSNQISLKKIDYGSKTGQLLLKISADKKRKVCMETMQDGYIKMAKHLMSKHPLQSSKKLP